jgi:hypothetical protein
VIFNRSSRRIAAILNYSDRSEYPSGSSQPANLPKSQVQHGDPDSTLYAQPNSSYSGGVWAPGGFYNSTPMLLQPDFRLPSASDLRTEIGTLQGDVVGHQEQCLEAYKQRPTAGWRHLIAVHKTLLDMYHDFFIACQQASTPQHDMPRRMWTYAIIPFLRLLQRGLPNTVEYMLVYVRMAYQMLTLLYETVPQFKITWVEFLRNLSNYWASIRPEDAYDDYPDWVAIKDFWHDKLVRSEIQRMTSNRQVG